jgi:Rer1 family
MDNEMEDGSAGGLPTKQDEEFRPFIRRLPEFKFWYSATRAIAFGFVCTWFKVFDVPVFWPVLVIYWLVLFALTSKFLIRKLNRARTNTTGSAETNPAYDQVQIRSVLFWQGQIQ